MTREAVRSGEKRLHEKRRGYTRREEAIREKRRGYTRREEVIKDEVIREVELEIRDNARDCTWWMVKSQAGSLVTYKSKSLTLSPAASTNSRVFVGNPALLWPSLLVVLASRVSILADVDLVSSNHSSGFCNSRLFRTTAK